MRRTPEIYRTTTDKQEAMNAYRQLRNEIRCNAALERKHTSVVLYEGVTVIENADTSGLYVKLRKYEVQANSLEEFCEKYHRPFENSDFGREQRKEWFAHAQQDLEKYGYIMIPSSTTTTGFHAVWYGGVKCGD